MKLDAVSRWAEVGANVGVVVTLIFLATEVRRNTRILEREAVLEWSRAMGDPFLENPALAEILADVKAIDGWGDTFVPAFAERYDTSIENAIVWSRLLVMVWLGLEADFSVSGPSQDLEHRIRYLLSVPDNQLLWEKSDDVFTPEFQAYVQGLRTQ